MNTPRPTRAVIVAPWAERHGGAEEMLWGFLTCLDRTKLELSRIVFLESGEMARAVSELGFPVDTIVAGRLRHVGDYLRTTSKLAECFRRDQPDLVVSWMAKAHLYSAPAAMRVGLGRRCVWWQHLVPNGHWVDRVATALPALAVGTSSTACANAQRKLRPSRPAFVVTPGVDTRRFGNGGDVADRARIRTQAGLGAETFVVVIVARLQPWKGPQHVISAIARLRAKGIDAGALIVGGEVFGQSVGFQRELERLASELGVAEHVHFAGQVADSRPYLAAADAAINASEGEPFGISVLEAMAAGLPVVAADNAGPREIISDGVTGLLLESVTGERIAAALELLAVDRPLAHSLGKAARESVRSEFTLEKAAARFVDSLTNIALMSRRRGEIPLADNLQADHVTIVIQHVAPTGGMERQVTELITGYLAAGWSVTVISRQCEIPPNPKLRWIRIRGPYRPAAVGYPWFFFSAGVAVRRHRQGIVHLNGALAPNRADVATVHFSHTGFRRLATPRVGSRNKLSYRVNAAVADWQARLGERWCYRQRRIPRLVAISDGVGAEAQREYGYPAPAVSVIPYGVDADVFARHERQREATRDELLRAEDELIVLFIGGDWGRKGLNAIVDALPGAPGWRLVVAGEGDEDAVLRRATNAGVASRVTMLGRREQPTALYSAADAFCLPTSYETFCLVAHEAAAAGLPLLVTRVHGVDVLLEDGVNGWFVSRDGAEIASRLSALRDDPALRMRMGEAARSSAERYPWSGAVAAHLALYQDIAGDL